MIKTDKITIIGEYLLDNKEGFIIGGQQFIKGLPPKPAIVNEETYELLLDGVKKGWFNLVSDDYDDYLASRGRKRTYIKPEIIEPEPEQEIKAESKIEIIETQKTEDIDDKKHRKSKAKQKQEPQ